MTNLNRSLEELAAVRYGTIETVLETHGIKPNRTGQACCPFHDDKNPSFSIKGERWTCWAGCGSGSLIDLVAKLEERDPADICRDLRRGAAASSQEIAPKPPPKRRLSHPAQEHPHFRGWRSTLLANMFEAGTQPTSETRFRGIPGDIMRGRVCTFTDEQWDARRAEILEEYREFIPFDAAPLVPEAYQISNKVEGTWHRYESFMVFAYWDLELHPHPIWPARGVVELRFRNLARRAHKDARYTQTKLFGAKRIPFLANPVLLILGTEDMHAHNHTLYVCEGELDALSIWTVGGVAIGIPGTHAWNDDWCQPWRECGRVVVMSDPDEAGDKLWKRIQDGCVKTHGPRWTRQRLRRQYSEDGRDINDLLQGEENA